MLFNPAAENVLASSSGDYTVKIWDLENGKPKLTLKGNDIFTSLSWSADGSTLVTTSRDKKLRFWDVRQEKPAHEVPGHSGAKSSRVVWLGDHDRVATTGFSKMSERQLALWDSRNPAEPIGGFMGLDSGSGVGMPFWDDGNQILYVAGKGDGNIRYYEYQNDKFEYLSEHRSPEPQRGIAFLPKRGVNTHDNEIMRAFKTVNDQYIEPISFVVPRRAETFQEDIYPPTVGTEPAVSSAEWFDGKSGLPPKLNMEDLYENRDPQMMAQEKKAAPTPTQSAPAPAPAAAQAPREDKVEEAARPPAPTPVTSPSAGSGPVNRGDIKSNQESMSAMANKFADHGEPDNDHDSDGSFEEIQKPVERPSVTAARQEGKVLQSPASQPTSAKQPSHPVSRQEVKVASEPLVQPSKTTSAPLAEPKSLAHSGLAGEAVSASSASPASEKSDEPASRTVSSSTPAAAAGGLRDVLNDIRGMLQSQGKQIEHLTAEVAALKAKVGE